MLASISRIGRRCAQRSLSPRQAEIAALVARGNSSREIGLMLHLSPRTVDVHIAAVLEKCEMRSRLELATWLASGDVDGGEERAALPMPQTNLPLSRSSLVGREIEIAEIVCIVRQSPLVTLTGAGGVGKTRTALAVGDALAREMKADVWLVELAPLARGDLVANAVARVLQLQESRDRPIVETLIAHLKQKPLLLILDNCEHVLNEAAALADALLSGCLPLKILTTSREPLRTAGEHTYRLRSLRVPTLRETSELSATGAAEYAAIVLFAQRAYASDRGFTLADNDVSIVAEICRRLDGIPLAIELAAARLNVLSLSALSTELDQRFRLLTSGNRTALPRHQTMRALIDWSYDLLCEPEQAVFRRLGVFAGGWTPEAAEAVCAGDGIAVEAVTDILWSLVDKSLVIADHSGERTRYRLLESTRAYALEKLARSGEQRSLAQQHADWVAALVERFADEYWTVPEALWLALLVPEIDNLRSALRWTLEDRGDAVVGGRIAGAVPQLWFNVCLIQEARRWFELALRAVDEATHPRIVGRLWLAKASLAFAEPRVRAAKRAIRCLEPLEDRLLLAEAHLRLALGHGHCLALALCFDAVDTALTLLRRPGLAQIGLLALALSYRASLFLDYDMYSEARAHYDEALALFREMGDERRSIALEVDLLQIEFMFGGARTALASSNSTALRAHVAGMAAHEASAHYIAAVCLLTLGQLSEAKGEARAVLALARSSQVDFLGIYAIQNLATVAALEGDVERAARLRGYIDMWFDSQGFQRSETEKPFYDILMIELRSHFSDERLAQLAEAGARLSENDVDAEAVGFDATHADARAAKFGKRQYPLVGSVSSKRTGKDQSTDLLSLGPQLSI